MAYIQLPNQNKLSGLNTLAYMGTEAADLRVTPLPATIVVFPAPNCIINIWVPTENASDDAGGTVKLLAEALFIVTILPASDSTKV